MNEPDPKITEPMRRAVEALVEGLEHEPQTTHGIIGDGSFSRFVQAFIDYGNNPRPYTAGTLYQVARQYLAANPEPKAPNAIPEPQR